MRKYNHHNIPKQYIEYIWLETSDLCDILNISRETCLSVLNQIYDQGSAPGYDFCVRRKCGHYKVEAASFWKWFNQNHCWVED